MHLRMQAAAAAAAEAMQVLQESHLGSVEEMRSVSDVIGAVRSCAHLPDDDDRLSVSSPQQLHRVLVTPWDNGKLEAVAEANEIQMQLGADVCTIQTNISPDGLPTALEGKSAWMYQGHSGYQWGPDKCLVFDHNGAKAAVTNDALVDVVLGSADLQFVMVNGCKSYELAVRLVQACREQHRRLVVMCWRTLVHDKAACFMGSTFATYLNKGYNYEGAFHRARLQLALQLENRNQEGLPYVQKWIEIDPQDARVDSRRGRVMDEHGRGRLAAGIPCFVTPENCDDVVAS